MKWVTYWIYNHGYEWEATDQEQYQPVSVCQGKCARAGEGFDSKTSIQHLIPVEQKPYLPRKRIVRYDSKNRTFPTKCSCEEHLVRGVCQIIVVEISLTSDNFKWYQRRAWDGIHSIEMAYLIRHRRITDKPQHIQSEAHISIQEE